MTSNHLSIGDTPIEEMICEALMFSLDNAGKFSFIISDETSICSMLDDDFGDLIRRFVFIFPQAPLLGYRADFWVHYHPKWERLGCLRSFVVECDGHDFHERTKIQAARDRQRDRIMTSNGLPVLRFTGSEIWRDSMACAAEIVGFIERERA